MPNNQDYLLTASAKLYFSCKYYLTSLNQTRGVGGTNSSRLKVWVNLKEHFGRTLTQMNKYKS